MNLQDEMELSQRRAMDGMHRVDNRSFLDQQQSPLFRPLTDQERRTLQAQQAPRGGGLFRR